MPSGNRTRIILLLAYVLASSAWVLVARPIYIVSILVVLVPPTLWTLFSLHRARAKVLWFAVLAGVLFAPPVELVARLTDAWDVASVFPRPFGLIPWENVLFAFLNFLWVLAFYERFVDRDSPAPRHSRRMRWLVGLYVVFAAAVFGGFAYARDAVAANYATVAVVVLVVPGIALFWRHPRLLRKTLLPTAFFAVVFGVYEAVSLVVGSWWWPGEYLLPLRIGGVVFPLDDVIIWYLLSTPVLIASYEVFADDGR